MRPTPNWLKENEETHRAMVEAIEEMADMEALEDTYYATYRIIVPSIMLESGSQRDVDKYVESKILQSMDIEGLEYQLEDVTEG